MSVSSMRSRAFCGVATIILRPRQFAVRQERWFRRDPRVRWVQIEHDPVAEVLPVIATQ